MVIHVNRTPVQLTKYHFKAAANLVDPNDGKPVDATTNVTRGLIRKIVLVDGSVRYADGGMLFFTPDCYLRTSATMTPGLLAHEQVHWDIFLLVARVAARELAEARHDTAIELEYYSEIIMKLHFEQRAGAIHSAYDVATNHGTNATNQTIWRNKIMVAMANPDATRFDSFLL